jgi:hypothetical protein
MWTKRSNKRVVSQCEHLMSAPFAGRNYFKWFDWNWPIVLKKAVLILRPTNQCIIKTPNLLT